MTQVLIDRATLEQLVRALKQIQALTDGRDIYLGSPPTESKERKILTLATECRAALANAEPKKVEKREPRIDLGRYAGTYGGYTTPTKDTPQAAQPSSMQRWWSLMRQRLVSWSRWCM